MERKINKMVTAFLPLLISLTVLASCGQQPASSSKDNIGEKSANNVVAKFGDNKLTNTELSYYFWTEYNSFLDCYGDEVSNLLDTSKPLSEQYYSQDVTWRDYFLGNAINSFKQYCAISDEAAKNNFKLSNKAQNSLANLESSLQTYSQAAGYGNDTAAYLKNCYGSQATLETYKEFMKKHYTVLEYSYILQQKFKHSDDEVSDYYDKHQDEYKKREINKDDTPAADVKCLTVTQDQKEKDNDQATDTTFNALAQEWEQSNEKTEKVLQNIGDEWNSKGAVQNDLDRVYPGKISLKGFDEWAFDTSRKPGDSTVLNSEEGKAVLYYVKAYDKPNWYEQAFYDMLFDDYSDYLKQLVSGYTYEEHLEKAVITNADSPKN